MSLIQNSLYMRAINKQPVERTPVWLMRQAGRYLPEYQKTRAKAGDFLSLCRNKELACEVTLQPLRRYNLDAAILFSDILTIPDAMGLGLQFLEGEGPKFSKPITSVAMIDSLPSTDVLSDLQYVMDAVSLIRQEMPANLPLIGFSGSPWTLACYMVEGGSSRDFKKILHLMYEEPKAVDVLLSKLSAIIVDYLDAQVKSGANALMLFDTWGGILTTDSYHSFSLKYLNFIVAKLKNLHPKVPVTLFTKGGGQWLEAIAQTHCDMVGVDWTCDLARARQEIGAKVALQGNLDPSVLRASPDCIRNEVAKVITAFGAGSGHVFNLGHGITPDVPPDNVSVMVDAVREFSAH